MAFFALCRSDVHRSVFRSRTTVSICTPARRCAVESCAIGGVLFGMDYDGTRERDLRSFYANLTRSLSAASFTVTWRTVVIVSTGSTHAHHHAAIYRESTRALRSISL